MYFSTNLRGQILTWSEGMSVTASPNADLVRQTSALPPHRIDDYEQADL